ncbi:MAG TPA: BTAD domain-containing putative transcriptional regulator [Gemmatimonadaceae bacterium]|nr:BTAD domain-containing putative transcriptional regulator [Gemmatimonadaceae bacterium]
MPATVPFALTPFIGRSEEVVAVSGLLASARLVTLTGAGGSGKTRLAAEVASRDPAFARDAVIWVELAPLADPELLPTYLLEALKIEHGARPPSTALIDSLREKDGLLVLDNCEHLVTACAGLAEAILRGCPRVRILATSREALGVAGERAWLVPGLVVPPVEAPPATIADAPAVRLFVDRAQAALSSFRLTASNAPAVAQVCRRLDGLPLAIELAAARVRALPPEELAGRLDDALRVLGSGSRNAVPRHRTLRAAVAWSYDLLDDRERRLLERLSMFAGDFSLHAAESVAADADLAAADVLDTIGALVDKSLVMMRETEGTARYYLLETIRQYASAKLQEAGQFHRVCQRHARTYMDLAAEAAPHLITGDRPRWIQAIHRELDNIRVALACTRDSDVAAHLKLSGDLTWFWYSTGLWSEGRRWQEGAMALPWTDEMRRSRATVLLGGAVLASLQGQPPVAIPWLEESRELFRLAGDRQGEAYALAYLGVSWGQSGDPRTVEPTNRALEWFRAANDLYGLRLCLVVLSTYHGAAGDPANALATGEEAVRVARVFGLDRELSIALQILASVRLALGDVPGAMDLLRESVRALRRDPSLFWSARALQLSAVACIRRGEAERGARLMGAAEVIREWIGAAMLGPDRAHLVPALAAGRAAIGDAAFDAAWKAGRAVSLQEMFDEILQEEGAAPEETAVAPGPEAPATFPLEVRALGPVVVLRDGVALRADAWRYARPRELLLYLLAHPEGRTRDQIGLVFFPDASPSQVKNNFHVMLHHVRKALGRADLIAYDGDRYRIAWELGVRFDARDFEEAVRASLAVLRTGRDDTAIGAACERIRNALPLYRGDFLADEEAGDWHLELRDRLSRLHTDALLALGDQGLRSGACGDAAELYRRVIASDELHEEAHRRLMEALARGGDRTAAIRQYDRLTHLLQTELQAEPEHATNALYERLKGSEAI